MGRPTTSSYYGSMAAIWLRHSQSEPPSPIPQFRAEFAVEDFPSYVLDFPAGSVELERSASASLTAAPGRPNCFQIVTKDRVWTMFADTAKDSEAWVKILIRTINNLPEVRHRSGRCVAGQCLCANSVAFV